MSIRYVDYEGLTTALTSMKSYVDDAVSGLSIDGYATDEELETAKSDLQTAIDEAVSGLQSQIEELSTTLTGVYTVKGSCDFGDLPDDPSVGDVWNITDGFELNDEEYTAGTNVVYTEDGWDALSGTIDLSAYVTTDELASTLEDYVATTDLEAVTEDEILALFE